MDESTERTQASPQTEDLLKRKNLYKTIRTVVQLLVLVAVVIFILFSLLPKPKPKADLQGETLTGPRITNGETTAEENRFIAISYPGLTESKRLDSKIVNYNVFKQQIDALKASGYVTISQEDIINYYLKYENLPEKALFLIFEDGIRNTTTLAQRVLEENGYLATVSTYANNLEDVNSNFITDSVLKSLNNNGFWETGSNGFRLSYINVFDRYGNYFGHLNANVFLKIYKYLWRDYNHYLMDFKRDEDRLRQESDAQLIARIREDYVLMDQAYSRALGYIPKLYILMHSNTGAFGTNPVASNANRDNMAGLFSMNFNRQGNSMNTLNSSIYDLTRLQAQSYFSANHLLMRIQDDTGDQLVFVTGDKKEVEKWYADDGVAEFADDRIILTSQPQGQGRITLKNQLFTDLDMTVTLQGNLMGYQSVYLRVDRNLQQGLQVAMENNEVVIRELGSSPKEIFRQSLFEFDGGPFISVQEDEYNGLVALQEALIQFDTDPLRIEEAKTKLAQLQNVQPQTLALGGAPYYPSLDLSDRGNRKLRIRLVGSRLSIWVDDRMMVEQLLVSITPLGSLAFGSEVYYDEKLSQRFLYDDVYDAVFINPIVRDAQNPSNVLFSYTRAQRETINGTIQRWFRTVTDFFVNNF
jgi:hypothetical protein